MTGTLGGALEARGIRADDGRLRSVAVGDIEEDGGTLVIRRIHMTYTLRIDDDANRAAIDRAHDAHATRCPVYRSLHPQIRITSELSLAGD